MYNKQRGIKSYSITSPYMELLQSKKKVYGLKYHSNFGGQSSNSKQNNHNNSTHLTSSKARPASSSAHHNKSNVKSNSSEKVKSTKTQNNKKKRIYTQQGESYHNEITSDPKLHESLFVNLMDKQTGLNSKSMFYNNPNANLQFLQAKQNQQNYLNNYDFLKKFSEFNTNIKQKQNQIYQQNEQYNNMINCSGSKSQKSQKSTKSKRKQKGKSKQIQQQQNQQSYFNNYVQNQKNYTRSINFDSVNAGKSVQNLNLVEVEDLVNLIDNCVSEANQYISFLASKVESLKNQVMKCKAQQFELQRIIKQKNQQLEHKDHTISILRKQLQLTKSSASNVINQSFLSINQDFKPKQMKKILQVLNEMHQQNSFLQSKIKNLESELENTKKSTVHNQKYFQQEDEQSGSNAHGDDEMRSKYHVNSKQKRKSSLNNKNNKQVYNQIHSKIDILNISIDNNKKITTANNYSISDEGKGDNKKYKFIKPKNK